MTTPPSISEARLAAGEMENRFRDASDLIERYLTEGAGRSSGSAAAATLHLTYRTLADLRCGQYLVNSGFVIQMASVVRPAVEALNLIELFAQDPPAADRWASGDDTDEFRPAKVRRRVGEGDDPVYSWLCELSHPRFAGFQVTAYQEVSDDEDSLPVLRAYIGGVPLEFPGVLSATMAPGNVLCMLAMQLGHAPVKKEIAWTWATVARRVPETLRPGYEAVMRVLAEHAEDADMAERMLANVDYVIEQAREMEAIVAEDRERQERQT